jgi:uncharacterized protein (DUF2235 family)
MARVERLIVCFDGTWNTPEDQTNVSRLYTAIADRHSGCPRQLKFYDAGVGTETGSKLLGGALGTGLSANIMQGYAWLVEQYERFAGERSRLEADREVFEAGAEIFIFGFSRGAFTARSLAGLVNRLGLLKRDELERARGRPDETYGDNRLLKEAWDLYRRSNPDKSTETRTQDPWKSFRHNHCWNVKVKCLGVWDTVGALGLPRVRNALVPFLSKRLEFHDTALGRVVEHAYHAIAIDEHREDYAATLWERPHKMTQAIEQRWFPGAHANVGGGYEDDLLPDPPLAWMAEKALALGLEFTDEFAMKQGRVTCKSALPVDFALHGNEHLSPVRDSYSDFMFGVYKGLRSLVGRKRFYRPMLISKGNETIDQSAHMKWTADPTYRPSNLAAAGRNLAKDES